MPDNSFSTFNRETKKQLLLTMKARLTDAPGHNLESNTLHPRWLSAGEPQQPFPLTDLQAAHFVAKHIPESDPVGAHMYLEFPVVDLDVDRLERAWRQLLDIHPMLRARIDRDGTQSVPINAPVFSIACYEVAADPKALDQHLEVVRAEMSHRVYQPGDWPLFDIRVTRVPGSASRVHVSMDSWIVDGASASLLYRQWRLLYDSLNAELPAPEATFRDFVLSMKAFEGSIGHRRCVDYWVQKLRDWPEGPQLPYRRTDDANPKVDAHRRRRLHWVCAPDSWSRLKTIVAAEGVSPSVAVLGVFAEQLRSFGWGDRFSLVLTHYNRPRLHPQIDQIVGPFSSTGIFIVDHRPEWSFADHLHDYQRQLWRDLDHGYVSGVAAMRFAAEGVRAQLIPVVFTSALGIGYATQSAANWLDDVDYTVSQTPGIDIHFQTYERTDGLHLACDVAYERFEPGLIDALFESVCLNLSQVASAGLTEGSLSERALHECRRALIGSAASPDGIDIPLTPLQQAYLAHRLINPSEQPGAVYREFDLPSFDPERLQAAVNAMIDCSAMLRSVLRADQAKFIEFANASYPVPIDDLRGLDADHLLARLEETRAEMERAMHRELGWPHFVVRASLLDGGTARLQVLLDLLVFDGYSVWLFYDELFRRYTEGDSEVVRPQLTCGDYARAREHYRRTAAYAADQLYWARKFRALPPGPQWPCQIAAGPALSRRYALKFNRWQMLKDSAAERGVPPVAVLLSLYAEVLHRWSHCESLTVVGVSYYQRSLSPDLAQAYGDCSSLAWLPSESDPSLTFEERLYQIADTLSRDSLHDWGNPFEALRGAGAWGDRRAKFPAVLTNCLNAPVHTRAGITEVCASSSTPGVDIDQMVVETEGGLDSYWQVRVDHVPPAIAAAMLDEYHDLLEELATDDAAWRRPLAELGLRSTRRDRPNFQQRAVEQAPAMYEWNRTDADYDREQCLHRLIERQAARNPNRVALVSDEGTLTYGQLERRANQLARYLQRQSVGRGVLVGVLLDRSLDTVIALVAILKAGAAYVPLSITDPRNRIASILGQADVNTVISKTPYAALLDEDQRVVLIDARRSLIEAEDGDSPPVVNSRSDDSAYVIFTSGSTGEPKGVVVCHRPVINLIEWAGKTFGFNEDDRVLFVNSLGFDLSVFDVFALLAYGGSIRLVSEQDRLDATRLAYLLLQEPITFWNSAPAYLQFVMPSLKGQAGGVRDRRLRLVFLSGDWIPLSLPGDVRGVFPSTRVVGLGGATEATVWSNYYPIGEIDPGWTSIPYGRPIQNARYYILDERLQPCSVGTPGHLYIGGECLSSGYLNAPDLTASRFVPDPFHDRPDMTMYYTGDLARFMNDGNIEFLGRVDDQVKIRGFRIELGEVEAALAKSGLGSPVAVVREDTPGNRLIVGFGTSRSMHDCITDQSFWQSLRDHLPDYMVPSQVYALPSLPMTVNGKVDRKRLARASLDDLLGRIASGKVELNANPAGRDTSAPRPSASGRASLTRLLCSTVAGILSLDPTAVQPDTHFSMLGVNSLHFALLSAKLAEATGTSISPAKLFHCASVTDIADTLAEHFPEALASGVADRGHAANRTTTATDNTHGRSVAAGHTFPPTQTPGSAFCELAVVGIHCIMPQAEGIDAFWANLVSGRHCIELIPRERWNWRAYYGDSKREENVTTVNRAGFVRDVDKFDAAFFSISPREAELMDPRQRMMLEGVWKTLEDAGYCPADLRGEPVGIYVGATGDEYASLLQQANYPIDQFSLTGAGRSFLTNRVSYYYGWLGPSEVIDTTCSSSLVALHNAGRAIQSGDCSMAIVGGLNIMIDPFPHLSLAKVGVLSPDSVCKTFDVSANGYVRGEGVGLLLVKPLRQAEADHDHIYAVIGGTAVNHGGRANALTAPNSRAQARVIVDAYRRSAVDPQQVGYIEAHGTGTSLGDPVEIEGIKEAFATLYRDRGQALPDEKRISVGSVKTSIGHLEAAAGISGLIKVILMLRHRMLPPLVHLKTLNPQIDVDDTPFFFQTKALAWDAPLDHKGHSLPRAAGVSAFGFGGVNAHVIVREYLPPTGGRESEEPAPTVIPLSARSKEQLAQYAERLRDALCAGRNNLRLEDVAFTLRVGREAFSERAAIVARSLDQLVDRLDAVCGGESTAQGVFYSNARSNTKNLSSKVVKAPPEALTSLPPPDLAQAWAWGLTVDWLKFYGERLPQRTSLPTYPFARVSHWPAVLRAYSVGPRFPRLVESNDRAQPGYVLRLTGEEFFIEDHRVNSVRVMPAAAYVGFAAGVAGHLYGDRPTRIRGLVWTRALRFTDELPKRLQLSLMPRGNAYQLAFRGEEAGEQLEYSSALLEPVAFRSQPSKTDVEALKRRCPEQYSAEVCYERLEDWGIAYGPSLRVIRTLWRGESEAIAHIVLPNDFAESATELCLHPAAADGALQSALLHQMLGQHQSGGTQTHMPFTVRQITAYGALPQECYVHVVLVQSNIGHKALRRYNLTVLKPDGEVLLELEECTGLPLERPAARSRVDMQLFRERWHVVESTPPGRKLDLARACHVSIGLPSLADALCRAGQRVLADALLPSYAKPNPGCGSAVPWDSVLGDLISTPPEALVLWYNRSRLSLLPPHEQLRFGFDTIFDLTKRLVAMRQLKRCCVVLCLISTSEQEDMPTLEALSGFAKVVQHESPKLSFKLVQCMGVNEPDLPIVCNLLLQAVETASDSKAECIEHRFNLALGTHEVRRLEPEVDLASWEALPVQHGGVYLITGGAGVIGRHLSRALLQQGAKVGLIGRSPAIGERAEVLKALGPAERVQYFQADVTDGVALTQALAALHANLGEVRGVFHCAGEAKGGLLLFKSLSVAREVVSAKVLGTTCLDEATQAEPIDFFVLFSSLASVTGPVGASDYAYANRYADLYAAYRNSLASRGLRRGKALAMSWPVWSDGGMRVPRQDLDYIRSKGLELIDSAQATSVLASCMTTAGGHYICAYGDQAKFEAFLASAYPAAVKLPLYATS